MGDWSNDRPSQFTARMVSDYNQASYNRSIGWNGLNWDQGGGAPVLSGGESITVMSVSITFGIIAGVVGFLSGDADPLMFAGFCFIVVFLSFAVLGYILKVLVLLLTGQLFKFGKSEDAFEAEPAATPAAPAAMPEEVVVRKAPAVKASVAAAPARKAVRASPRIFTSIVWGTAIGALAGAGIAMLAGPDIAAWEGVVRFAPAGALIGAVAGLLRKRAWRRRISRQETAS